MIQITATSLLWVTHPCQRRCIWSGNAGRCGDSCPGACAPHHAFPPQTPPSPGSSRPASHPGLCARGPGWRWSDASDWCLWWSMRSREKCSERNTERRGRGQIGSDKMRRKEEKRSEISYLLTGGVHPQLREGRHSLHLSVICWV